jgi:hypothetical protein
MNVRNNSIQNDQVFEGASELKKEICFQREDKIELKPSSYLTVEAV